MSPHRVENTVRRDQRFARGSLSRRPMGGASGQGRHARDESFVFIAPFHHDPVSERFAHQSTPSLYISDDAKDLSDLVRPGFSGSIFLKIQEGKVRPRRMSIDGCPICPARILD